mmetsp:Transcript_11666/g.24054  ORF Transcript_11666/g.24054 Transcript_11666/m.24054 type:complete len:89 (+) Transcript_11666:767-1033(+)
MVQLRGKIGETQALVMCLVTEIIYEVGAETTRQMFLGMCPGCVLQLTRDKEIRVVSGYLKTKTMAAVEALAALEMSATTMKVTKMKMR